jgi:hypothetical protein
MADSIGFEPMHRLLDDGLAIRCINHSANYPIKMVGPPGLEPGTLRLKV